MWRLALTYHGILLLTFTLLRGIFFAWNAAFLEEKTWFVTIFIKGLLFDWVATSWILLPAWIAWLTGQKKVGFGLWLLAAALSLALEVIDIGYFPYTRRRSGLELLLILSFWQDTLPALSKYIRDFALGFLLWGFLVGVLFWIGKKLITLIPTPKSYRLLGWLISLACLGVGLRGGLRLKPLSVVDAAPAGCPSCAPFVLNTTFSLLRAIEQPRLPPWPDPPPGLALYPRPFAPAPEKAILPRANVVVFILESFSHEYIERGYAPFLASLLQKGLQVKWGFATNSRSAEGVPAILSGLPSWGEEPLIFTPYASRIQYSLGEILAKWGYTTAFFHGGNNGTMLLDAYAAQAGFHKYFGRKEYPYPTRDYDGTWGIWDEPFLQFCAEKIGELREPFLAVIFTLSSHHPYAIPATFRDSVQNIHQPVYQAVRYADWALSRFFARVETTAWAKRTLFVFTADHTGPSEEAFNPIRAFHVPIGFYMPGRALPVGDSIASHIDILPSILAAIGYPYAVPVWGHSIWDSMPDRWAPQKPLPLLFQAIGRAHIVRFSPGHPPQVQCWSGTPWQITHADTLLPPWYADWMAYLAGYGRWLQGPHRSPNIGRTTTSSTTVGGGKCAMLHTSSATASGGIKRSGG